MRARELLVEALARVVRERARGLACDVRRRLGAHLLALEIALERVEEEAVVRDGEPASAFLFQQGIAMRIAHERGGEETLPVEHFLLLLRADALVLEEQVEERALWREEAKGQPGRGRLTKGRSRGTTAAAGGRRADELRPSMEELRQPTPPRAAEACMM